MALGALLLLSCGERREKKFKREQAELKRKQAAFLASRCDVSKSFREMRIPAIKPKASKPAR
jgi:hypothetical protein